MGLDQALQEMGRLVLRGTPRLTDTEAQQVLGLLTDQHSSISKLSKSEVYVSIDTDSAVPAVYVYGVRMSVVSCSYEYVTNTDRPGTNAYHIRYYNPLDKEPIINELTIDNVIHDIRVVRSESQ